MRLAINLGNGKRGGAAWMVILTFATTGCVAFGDPGSTIDIVQAPVATSTTLAPATTATSTPTTTAVPTPTKKGLSIADDFVAFGTEWNDETFSRLPVADSVMLGLGSKIIRTVDAADLRDPAGWDLDVEQFRAIQGPFSAGRLLANTPNEYDVNVGEHPHCVSPPQPPPDEFAPHVRISLQPPAESFDTCLQWFTVDFFVNTSGLVEAITMDIWEP